MNGLNFKFAVQAMLMFSAVACEVLDNDPEKHIPGQEIPVVPLEDVALILSGLPLQAAQISEVHDAVTSSSGNGYDEEYTMERIFGNPGSGVGDPQPQKTRQTPDVLMSDGTGAGAGEEPVHLRDLIAAHLRTATKSAGIATAASSSPEAYLEALTESDIQIYWPYSENWDGKSMPVITFDPEDGSETNIGYRLYYDKDGNRQMETVVVDEETAKKEPVWVVNRNSDAGYTSLELLRREDPDWGSGGGTIVVKPSKTFSRAPEEPGERGFKSLVLKEFTMKRNYDSWFAGASEFFVKTGAVEDFCASTEAEMRLYSPTVTDFMIVVKRNQVGIPQPFNAVLVSEWTEQMTHCAFMITEDDGGTWTDWNCTALVRVASKSYGVEIKLPFKSRDDIVWRGQLASKWLEANSNITGHFGDVDLTFEVVEH